MINLKKHIRIALLYFLIVTLLGVLLRFFQVIPIPLNYKFILHAHSHTALLGFIYVGITTVIYKLFLSSTVKSGIYKKLFIFTNICILGMLATFPFQGYALFSIIFSTLFLFASYWFSWFAIKNVSPQLEERFSWKLCKTALIYLIVSSIGPWAIGGVMATLGQESIWYKISIYFYLHFQYNGWFIFALLGVLFYVFEEKGIVFNKAYQRLLFRLLNFGVLATFFLSILWIEPSIIFYILGFVGAAAQIVAFYLVYKMIKRNVQVFKIYFSKRAFFLVKVASYFMMLKLVMQLLSAFPYIANLAFQFRDFVIGYLHLVFLGIVITTLIAFLDYFKLLKLPKSFISIFLLAFCLTESLIFYKVISLWFGFALFPNFYLWLAILSCLFPVSALILVYFNFKSDKLIAKKLNFLNDN